MANFFYFDNAGMKQGPITDAELKSLSAQSIITPETLLETDDGHKGKAGQIERKLEIAGIDTAEEHNANFNGWYSGNIQNAGVGIGRIVVFISVGLGVISYFLPWLDMKLPLLIKTLEIQANAFQVFQKICEHSQDSDSQSIDMVLGIVFITFIAPTLIALIKNSIDGIYQFICFTCAVVGIAAGLFFFVHLVQKYQEMTATGEVVNAGAGPLLFIVACIGLIVGTALYNRRLPNG
jgi:heme/copper-type cytochrome/quinol oxidase subunit 4